MSRPHVTYKPRISIVGPAALRALSLFLLILILFISLCLCFALCPCLSLEQRTDQGPSGQQIKHIASVLGVGGTRGVGGVFRSIQPLSISFLKKKSKLPKRPQVSFLLSHRLVQSSLGTWAGGAVATGLPWLFPEGQGWSPGPAVVTCKPVLGGAALRKAASPLAADRQVRSPCQEHPRSKRV